MTPPTPNSNWPNLFAEGQFASNPYYGTIAGTAWTDMSPRLYKAWTIRRGKQYELDQVQPGEFHGQWVNTDGFLDPSNATSPYAPVPYRGYRVRTHYPPSVNVLQGDQATGGLSTPLPVGFAGNNYGILSAYGTYLTASSGTAFYGSQVWQITGTTGSTGSALLFTNPVPTLATPGTPYVFTVRVRSVTGGANPTVTPNFGWVSPSGNGVSSVNGSPVALTGSTSAAWTTITITTTVPGPSFGLYPVAAELSLILNSAPGGTWSFQVDGVQLEPGATASSFSVPGVAYPVYSGMIERYPQSWNYAGTYGVVSPVCVDTMALLSQTILKEAFINDVETTAPQWFFALNEPSGATTFAEQTGNTPSAGLFVSGYGAGVCTPGTNVVASNPTIGLFLGTNGPVVTFNNPASNAGTVISLDPAGINGPPNSDFTRMIAFRTASANGMIAASTTGLANGISGPGMFLALDAFGNVEISVWNAAQQQLGVASVGNDYADDNWHLVFWQLDTGGTNLTLTVDNASWVATGGFNYTPVGCVDDGLGGDMYSYSGLVNFGGGHPFIGDLAHAAQWNTSLVSLILSNLYSSWRTAWQGESTDQRYSRILGYAKYVGPSRLDVGATTQLQPANDIGGQDALTALQDVVNTEAGRHFVAADGSVTFLSRTREFQSVTPVWTFGENQGSGEIPYIDLQLDFDPTRISNSVTVTQRYTNQAFFAQDVPSQQAYGTRTFTRDNQALDQEECRSSAFYYLSRYKQPRMRVASLRVDVASNPALWVSALSFEIGQLVAINRRSVSGAPTIALTGFIEQITHSGDDNGAWGVELQISPTTVAQYASFTDLRTTMHTQANAGTSTAVINALSDASVNVLQANLTAGQLLTFGTGATSEELTIATGGVPTTSLGYTSATITLASSFAFTHPVNDPVIEFGGVNLDSLAVFDTVDFAY